MSDLRSSVKDAAQRFGLNKWFQNGRKGTLEYATGVGKTRCGVLAAAYVAESGNMDAKILILTPTQTIRDQAWVDEFKKWGKLDTYNKCVQLVCIQTAYRWKDQHFDLVIADEIHNYIPDPDSDTYEFFKFFENNSWDSLLGLSASISPKKLPILTDLCPIVDSIDTAKAVRLGLVSPFIVYNLYMSLTEDEQKAYNAAHSRFEHTFGYFHRNGRRNLKIMFRCLDPAFFKRYCNNYGYDYEEIHNYPYICNKAMSERKRILYEASNKLQIVKELSDTFPDKSAIIFSQTTEFADKVTSILGNICVSFHSKILPKSLRAKNLKRLTDGRTRINRISTAKALNEGANVPNISLAIVASSTSSPKDWIQRIGRAIRWKEDKRAIIVRLIVKGTQEEKWVESAQEGYYVINIQSVSEIDV